MYRQIATFDETKGTYGLANTIEEKYRYLREAEMRNTDWFSELFNHNISHNHSVSISKKKKKASFYGSISAMLDPGWTLRNKANRYTANFNAMFNLSKTVSLSILSNGSYRKQTAPGAMS